MQVGCYKTQQELIIKSCCKLIERSFDGFKKTLVITMDAENSHTIDQTLWTYSRKHFIPHATIDDPLPESQPVLIANYHQLQQIPHDQSESVVLINLEKTALVATLEHLAKNNTQKLSIIYDEHYYLQMHQLEDLVRKHLDSITKIMLCEQLTVDKWKYVA